MSKSSLLAPIAAGVATAFVGFASSFAVVLKGLTAVGASDAQAASGLMALSIAMGIAGIVLSLWFRMPISGAWSTPGAALLAATGAATGGFAAATGAFLVVGVLIVAAGLVRPFGRAVAAIPSALANAMLAGILFGLCLAPIKALIDTPMAATLVILAWLLVSRWNRLFATPAAAIVAALLMAFSGQGAALDWTALTPTLVWTAPQLSIEAVVSLALPLFIVTMASQNLPGLAVLSAYQFKPRAGPADRNDGGLHPAGGAFRRPCREPQRGHRGDVRLARRVPRPLEALDRLADRRFCISRLRHARGRRDAFRRGLAAAHRSGGGPRSAQRLRFGAAQRAGRRLRARGGAGDLSGFVFGRRVARDRRRFLGSARGRRDSRDHPRRRFRASTARQASVNSICAPACAVMLVGS